MATLNVLTISNEGQKQQNEAWPWNNPPPASENVMCTSDLPRGWIFLFDENTIKRSIHLDMIKLFVFTYNEYNEKEKEQDLQSFPSNA